MLFGCSNSHRLESQLLRPNGEYSSNTVEFLDVTSASGVKDITPAILQLLASERPNTGLHWTRR